MQTQHRESTIARLRSLTHLLDNALPIPGTKYRVGIDPLIGLLPGGGDVAMSLVSVYIVVEAARLGIPRASLARMMWNLILDALLGIIPMAGDFVDLAWKANSKNLALIEAHLAQSRQQEKADYLFVALLVVVFLSIVLALSGLTIFLIGSIWNAIFR
ncbi:MULTISPECIES: DUF4112 domain-containing protein [Leptolyngbya]|jgi:hypothetical protein|uniref:DUF4112 domain-containing protein n=1 Tax=Leptolyngbya boryana NIES-2135 TaxID=1973484 RepID=A0A1Z4JLT7_LEPBY|nr:MULTISPECIES: DUF4112 domain-containing protein [Leptolyngbya]BAY57557.1 hypothetical protein NIES2135_44270 [Leptolyngbya boryana NIES-2135]MBD2367514.1 DUF4112 domain-containing protein [Leptolyngbya sp. FACHB-161]MBD2374038.1 DUF4112 domain-containing protein [Leptolyngbya sp. FACHB-238]MBD2398663.1 DUF4112 domain-containing protein [Leptolyngbya sp. FACHB-239]MBD2404887.1 DUF4112 domain-containing protein [Leptolyngbya sp. FACHB-402]